MRIRWANDVRGRMAMYALGSAAVLSIVSPYMRVLRAKILDPGRTFQVTRSGDDGPGSLRMAILDADRAPGRARIVVTVLDVTLSAALPPLVNPDGIVLESRRAAVTIHADGVMGAVIDIAAPHTTVSNLRIVGGRVGVVVRAAGAVIRGLTVEKSDVGIFVGDRASETHVDESAFVSNGVGIQIDANTGATTVQRNRFERNGTAGVWAVAGGTGSPARVMLVDNHFRGDTQGAVIVGLTAEISRNSFDRSNGNAVHASASRVVIRENTMRAGLGFGVYLERSATGRIERNEIAHNCAGGIMLRSATNAQVERNQIFQNGHGIVVMEGSSTAPAEIVGNLVADHVGDGVAVIGAAAVVSGNQVFGNRRIGLHVSSLPDAAGYANPGTVRLAENTLRNNGLDEAHDVFQPDVPASSAGTGPGACSWRDGVVGLIALGATR